MVPKALEKRELPEVCVPAALTCQARHCVLHGTLRQLRCRLFHKAQLVGSLQALRGALYEIHFETALAQLISWSRSRIIAIAP